jgi:hypothetical protein
VRFDGLADKMIAFTLQKRTTRFAHGIPAPPAWMELSRESADARWRDCSFHG